MWEQLGQWEKIGLLFILMGSIVDLVQFSWIIKTWFCKIRNNIYNRVKKEILLDQLTTSQEKHEKETFPGIKVDE